jgi:hypothetical protein
MISGACERPPNVSAALALKGFGITRQIASKTRGASAANAASSEAPIRGRVIMDLFCSKSILRGTIKTALSALNVRRVHVFAAPL